tara:strand:+ start:403 stop:984 length:582 start_codon:yes stop_codon:yes gene_type:complete
MANTIKNSLLVKGNDKLLDELHKRFDSITGFNNILGICKAFYSNIETDDSGENVKISWLYDNVGSKWITLSDTTDTGAWNIESANYTPEEFWIHIFKLCIEIYPNAIIEVIYEDENYSRVGAFVVKKDNNGSIQYVSEEDSELVDPTIDMDYDDENYEEKRTEFAEKVYVIQNECLAYCHKLIDTDEGIILED